MSITERLLSTASPIEEPRSNNLIRRVEALEQTGRLLEEKVSACLEKIESIELELATKLARRKPIDPNEPFLSAKMMGIEADIKGHSTFLNTIAENFSRKNNLPIAASTDDGKRYVKRFTRAAADFAIQSLRETLA